MNPQISEYSTLEPPPTSLSQRLKCAAYFGESSWIERVYSPREQAELREFCRFVGPVFDLNNFDAHLEILREVEVIFSTWGMPRLTADHLDRLPNLRAVFFAAGSVKQFAKPFLERDIIVVSAWRANAVPTSDFAYAQILLSMKGAFRNQCEYRSPEDIHLAFRGPGNYDESVALLGLGTVGTRVAELLQMLDVTVLGCDPYLTAERAAALGVERVTLEEAFARAFVVSNHMPLLPETEGILTAKLFASMRPNATFINTARGSIVDEPGMIAVLKERPDLHALLDVSNPEPPIQNSDLFTLPNIQLTAHMAGAINNEVRRLGRACVREFHEWREGRPLANAVNWDLFSKMA